MTEKKNVSFLEKYKKNTNKIKSSVDPQSVRLQSWKQHHKRKKRFRRVSDMFKLSQTLTRRERKRKKKFRLRNTIGNREKKRATMRRRKKSSRKKFSVWKIIPLPQTSQVAPWEDGGGGASRTCLKHGTPCSSPFKNKGQKINFDVVEFLFF